MRCLMPLRCDETMMPATTPIMAPTNAPGPCATTAPTNVPTIKPNAHMMVLPVCLAVWAANGSAAIRRMA